jgi:hypothetical protein
MIVIMKIRYIFIVIGILVLPIATIAQDEASLLRINSLVESLQIIIENLTRQVQQRLPVTNVAMVLPRVADITNSGTVGEDDWLYMRSKWFSNDTDADLNGDGVVNSIDFGILNGNWNETVQY